MVRFWDSSALVPLIELEPMTDPMTELLAADPDIVVWVLTPVELTSALARRAREQANRKRNIETLIAAIESTWRGVAEVRRVADGARVLLQRYPLRAADALQLSAALWAANGRPGQLPFVTLDHRLAEAARTEGFEVHPTNL